MEALIDIASIIAHNYPELIVNVQEGENVTIDLPEEEYTMDYIDLGILLIRIIENERQEIV